MKERLLSRGKRRQGQGVGVGVRGGRQEDKKARATPEMEDLQPHSKS